MEALLILAGSLALLAGLIFFSLLEQVRAYRFRRAAAALIDRAGIPAYLGEAAQPYEDELAEKGFVYHHCQAVEPPFVNEHATRRLIVLTNAELFTYASIAASDFPEAGAPCTVELITRFSDGTRLSTVNGMAHRIVGTMPGCTLQDAYSPTLEGQWEAHRRALEELRPQKTPVLMGPEEFVTAYESSLNRYVESLEESGWLCKAGEHRRLRLVPALRTVFKMVGGEKKMSALRGKMGKTPRLEGLPEAPPVEMEEEAFGRIAGFGVEKTYGPLTQVSVYLGVMILCALVIGTLLSFGRQLWLLLAAILLHDVGRLAAAALLKADGRHTLLLPLIGPVAGRWPYPEGRMKPLQEAVVTLAGPLPGLVLGVLGLLFSSLVPPLLRDGAGVLLLLNVSALAPIRPLDGGRLLRLVDARIPFLQPLLQAAFVLFILLVAAATPGKQLLAWLWPLLVVAVFLQMKNAAFLLRFRRHLSTAGGDAPGRESPSAPVRAGEPAPGREGRPAPGGAGDVLGEIFRFLRKKPFDRATFARRYVLARMLLEGAGRPLPSWGLALSALLFYLGMLLVSGGALVASNDAIGGLLFRRPQSPGPFHARVRIAPESRKTLYLAFTRTGQGEGGVDTLLVGPSLDGKPPRAMAPAKVDRADTKALFSIHSFTLAPGLYGLAGDCPRWRKSACSFSATFMQGGLVGEPRASLYAQVTHKDASGEWCAMLSRDLALMGSREKAVVTDLTGPADAKLTVAREQDKSGKTGVALELLSGASRLDIFRNGQPVEVSVRITDGEGRQVHAEKVSSLKMGFG